MSVAFDTPKRNIQAQPLTGRGSNCSDLAPGLNELQAYTKGPSPSARRMPGKMSADGKIRATVSAKMI
jgi:hypothetical protein